MNNIIIMLIIINTMHLFNAPNILGVSFPKSRFLHSIIPTTSKKPTHTPITNTPNRVPSTMAVVVLLLLMDAGGRSGGVPLVSLLCQ